MQDRFGAFGGQGNRARRVGVTPGGDQDRNLPSAFREVGLDVPEVGLGPRSGLMLQRNEGLASLPPLLLEVAPDLVVLADVALLSDESPVNLAGGVSLLAWRGLVVGDNLVDERAKGTEDRRSPGLHKR